VGSADPSMTAFAIGAIAFGVVVVAVSVWIGYRLGYRAAAREFAIWRRPPTLRPAFEVRRKQIDPPNRL